MPRADYSRCTFDLLPWNDKVDYKKTFALAKFNGNEWC